MKGASPARASDFRLLLWTFLPVAIGYLTVLLVRFGRVSAVPRAYLWPAVVYAASLAAVGIALRAVRSRADPALLSSGMLLAGVGMLAQFRLDGSAPGDGVRLSDLAFPGGIGLMVIAAVALGRGRYRSLAGLGMPCLLASVLLLGGIAVWGRRFRGSLFLPGNVNPAELTRVLLTVFLASLLAAHAGRAGAGAPGSGSSRLAALMKLGGLWAIPMALLLVQRDLGLIVVLNSVAAILVAVAAGRRRLLFGAGLAVLVLVGLMLALSAHGHQRFVAWYDPFRDPTGRGWQVLQSLAAMYAGGAWGTGLGAGDPAAVPIASSDFVYAAIGEELGFAGCGLVIGFYLVLFHRGYRAAAGAGGPFGRLLAAGLASGFAVQTLLNVGGVTKAIPLTGIPLPFISRGGSSLVTGLVALGMLLAVSDDSRSGPAGRRGPTAGKAHRAPRGSAAKGARGRRRP